MTVTIEEVGLLLTEDYRVFNEAHERIARLSLLSIALQVRDEYPEAAFVEVDATDQDMSGALVYVGTLDADRVVLDDEEMGDALWNELLNLSDGSAAIRDPFILAEHNGHVRYLDLQKIIDSASDLAPPFPTTVTLACAGAGLNVMAQVFEIIHDRETVPEAQLTEAIAKADVPALYAYIEDGINDVADDLGVLGDQP